MARPGNESWGRRNILYRNDMLEVGVQAPDFLTDWY